MNMTYIKDYYIVFEYGIKRYISYQVDQETPKKVIWDRYKDDDMKFKISPETILKNSIIHITKDKQESLEVCHKLNTIARKIKKHESDLLETLKVVSNTEDD